MNCFLWLYSYSIVFLRIVIIRESCWIFCSSGIQVLLESVPLTQCDVLAEESISSWFHSQINWKCIHKWYQNNTVFRALEELHILFSVLPQLWLLWLTVTTYRDVFKSVVYTRMSQKKTKKHKGVISPSPSPAEFLFSTLFSFSF